MSIELKIKSKHLALEPAIIRKEERKLLKRAKYYRQHHQIGSISLADCYKNHPDLLKIYNKETSLRNHRLWDVRNESRATFIARAYIKGIPFKSVEQNSNLDYRFKQSVLPRVFDMIAKYGKVHVRKYWDGKKQDYRPEEKEKLMSEIKAWLGIE